MQNRTIFIFKIAALFTICLLKLQVNAYSIKPAQGSELNYRLIAFDIRSALPGGAIAAYNIEIAKGHITNADEFNKNITLSATAKNGKAVIEVPEFGVSYTWRISKNNIKNQSNYFYYFSTLSHPNVDTANFRVIIKKEAIMHKDAFVFMDGSRALYNMKGEAVWYLPDIKGLIDNYSIIRDLKISPFNTITFISFDKACEVNYDGKLLWKAPDNGKVSGEAQEHYHHEFTRLKNGHYMVLGQEMLPWEWKYQNGRKDSMLSIIRGNTTADVDKGIPKLAQFGTVIEYDAEGKVVWSWKSSTYFTKKENLQRLHVTGPFGFEDTHQNAFYFDEMTKSLYLSFKNTAQILKVGYPEGTVTGVYEGKMPGIPSLFSDQHSIKITKAGSLYLYNNNMITRNEPPQIAMFEMPVNSKGKMRKTWQYTHPGTEFPQIREPLTSGGNVTELPDASFLVSSCVPWAQVFIVNKKKELLWDAVLQKWDINENIWASFPQYRASIITDTKQLEDLMWNAAE